MERPKPTSLHDLLFVLFLLSSLSQGHLAGSLKRRHPTPFDVGVVLDTTSWVGNISWPCMELAIEDFYLAHPNYSTRLALHLRESGGDSFGAASAALDLLQSVQVQSIIGPEKSTQAKFLVELGNKTQVPIISFSAKNPSLSTTRSPYFVRTGLNDSTQAQVIASIVQTFKWKQVVPVFEDSAYGAGIVPYLIDAFQESGARVPYRSMIPLSATENQIQHKLNELKKMQTRVFIVHMSYSLGLQLFQFARKLRMMGKGYVWITTYGLTDLPDLMGSTATSVMQGVLGIKPYVNEASIPRSFKLRWKKKFYQRNPNPNYTVAGPTMFGLWAYDTVWSLALAAENVRARNPNPNSNSKIANSSMELATLGVSKHGSELIRMMRNINFDGMSGKFQLIDGQLDTQVFEIINVVGYGKRRVGFWTPENGISRYIESKADLVGAIEWSGGEKTTPRGWEWPTEGKKLKILVPVKPGFEGFVELQKHKKGFCIQVFEEVIKALSVNYSVHYKFYPFENDKGESNGTYDDLIYQIYLQNYDAVVGDVTIIANRSLYVDFTQPFTESGVSIVVPIKDKDQKNAWTFTKPLTSNLWFASLAFFFFTGFVIWVLEHRINSNFRGTPNQQLGTVSYFSFSTLVFAHNEKVVSNLSRVVIVVWLFVVLILTQSYTATLTSMLTVQQLQPTVSSLDDLIRNGDNVGYLKDSFIPGLLKGLKFDVSKLRAYNSPEEYNEAMSNGSVAAIVDEKPYLNVFLSKYCDNYTMVGQTYKSDGFGFVFPKGSPLVPDVSRAILSLIETNISTLENILYKNRTCVAKVVSTATWRSLSFKSFWGLFLITGVTSLSAIVLHLVFFIYEHYNKLRTHDVSTSLALLAKLYKQTMDPSNAVVVGDVVTIPDNVSGLLSMSTMSSHTHSQYGPDEDSRDEEDEEGTPGREVSGPNPEPPSFAEMVQSNYGVEEDNEDQEEGEGTPVSDIVLLSE